MQQLQRYLIAHPQVADVVDDPRGGGSRARRPDWRLAEYLRLAKNGPSVGTLRGATVNDRTANSSFFTKTELVKSDRRS